MKPIGATSKSYVNKIVSVFKSFLHYSKVSGCNFCDHQNLKMVFVQGAAGNINISKKIKVLFLYGSLSDVRDF
jgi:hypothetical protein